MQEEEGEGVALGCNGHFLGWGAIGGGGCIKIWEQITIVYPVLGLSGLISARLGLCWNIPCAMLFYRTLNVPNTLPTNINLSRQKMNGIPLAWPAGRFPELQGREIYTYTGKFVLEGHQEYHSIEYKS